MFGNKSKDKAQEEIINEVDLSFLSLVLPRGIIRESWALRNREMCRTFLLAYAYPAYLEDLALSRINSHKGLRGVVITLDVTTKNQDEAKKEVKISLNELTARASTNRDTGATIDDSMSSEDIGGLYRSLSRQNEAIISGTLRFLVTAPTPDELRVKVDEVQKILRDYGIETFLPENEMIPEHRAIISHSDTVKTSFPLRGTFSRQFPFRTESLLDPRGLYLGYTSSGQVYLDTTLQNKERLSFDMLLWGMKGSGKTATIKSMIQHMICCGNKVYCFTVEPEFDALVERLGGRMIDPYSEAGRINLFQLPRTVDTSTSDTTFELDPAKAARVAYTTNTARIMEFFELYQPEMSGLDAESLHLAIHHTYQRFGITPDSDIAAIRPDQYPRLRDLRDTIRMILSGQSGMQLSPNKQKIYESLETYVSTLCFDGPISDLFDCWSTFDISDERFVVFDLSKIRQQGSRLYNAYLHTVINMCWEQLPANKLRNAQLSGADDPDRTNIAIVIPEAHSMLNADNPIGTQFIESLVRRARKYDAGIWFDSQHASDFFPKHDGAIAEKIRTVFDLVQYKAILQQSGADKAALQQLMPHLTPAEIDATVTYSPGEMLLSIGAASKLRLKAYIPAEDLKLFGGGREG